MWEKSVLAVRNVINARCEYKDTVTALVGAPSDSNTNKLNSSWKKKASPSNFFFIWHGTSFTSQSPGREPAAEATWKTQGRFKSFLTMPSKVTVCQGLIDRWQQMFGLHGGMGEGEGVRDGGGGGQGKHKWDNAVCIDRETENIYFFLRGALFIHAPVVLLCVPNQSPNGRHITATAKGCCPSFLFLFFFLPCPITSTCQVTPKDS